LKRATDSLKAQNASTIYGYFTNTENSAAFLRAMKFLKTVSDQVVASGNIKNHPVEPMCYFSILGLGSTTPQATSTFSADEQAFVSSLLNVFAQDDAAASKAAVSEQFAKIGLTVTSNYDAYFDSFWNLKTVVTSNPTAEQNATFSQVMAKYIVEAWAHVESQPGLQNLTTDSKFQNDPYAKELTAEIARVRVIFETMNPISAFYIFGDPNFSLGYLSVLKRVKILSDKVVASSSGELRNGIKCKEYR
jgi:hypothetical protein